MKKPDIIVYENNRLHVCSDNGNPIFFTKTGYKLNNDSDSSLLIIAYIIYSIIIFLFSTLVILFFEY